MRTGRTPHSDAEKRRKGTFDPRFSEEARAERAHAKVVTLFGGDRLGEVPEPPEGLSPQAVQDYYAKARRLHETGRLTQTWVDKTVLYAVRRHSILMRIREGKAPKDGDLRGCEMYLKEFAALDIDVAKPAAGAPEKRFSPIADMARMVSNGPPR